MSLATAWIVQGYRTVLSWVVACSTDVVRPLQSTGRRSCCIQVYRNHVNLNLSLSIQTPENENVSWVKESTLWTTTRQVGTMDTWRASKQSRPARSFQTDQRFHSCLLDTFLYRHKRLELIMVLPGVITGNWWRNIIVAMWFTASFLLKDTGPSQNSVCEC